MKRLLTKAINQLADQTGIRVLPDLLPHPTDAGVQTLHIPAYVQSQPHTCGYVAALMIIRYFRPDFSAERLYGSIRPHPQWGVSRRRLQETLTGCGLRVTRRTDLSFVDITDAIDQNRPIAMLVRRNADTMHWVVCYGYGRKPNRLYLAATGVPLLSRYSYPYGFFANHLWAHRGFGLVCGAPR